MSAAELCPFFDTQHSLFAVCPPLRAVQSGDRIPVGAKFSAPVQTGPGAHPAPCTMGTGSFLGVKRLGRSVDHPPPSSAEVEGRVELYIRSPSGPSWSVLGWPLSLPLPVCSWNGVHLDRVHRSHIALTVSLPVGTLDCLIKLLFSVYLCRGTY